MENEVGHSLARHLADVSFKVVDFGWKITELSIDFKVYFQKDAVFFYPIIS